MASSQKSTRITLPPDREPKVLGIFVREKDFYKTFFPLLFMIAAQQLAAMMVNLVDNLQLGGYTELALSGATLCNQLQFILQQLAAGIGLGIVVLGSRYWGRRETGAIKKIISIGVKLGLLIGVIFFVAAQLAPRQILTVLTSDTDVVEEGMKYLRVISWTYLLFSVSNSLMFALQSVETAAIGTVMSCSTICINLFFNNMLIYGRLGAPELGIVGAAVATLISRAVELIIILVYIFCIDKKLKMRPAELLRWDGTYLSPFIKVSTPVVIKGLLWGVAQAAQTAVLGHISASTIAANSIATVVFQVFSVVGMSGGNASSVMISKTIGAGHLDKVRAYAKTLQGIFVIMGLCSGALIAIFKTPIIGLYAASDETRALASSFLTILSITTIGSCYEYPIEGGIITGGGDTKYAAIMDNLFMWLFTIPSAMLSAFVFHFSPITTFAFLKADQLLKCIPNGIVCNRFRWAHALTAEDQQE